MNPICKGLHKIRTLVPIVYGIPINVSPVRESRKKKGVYHFNAHLSNGKRCVRVVLFDTSHLEVMKKAIEGKVSVLVDDGRAKSSMQ